MTNDTKTINLQEISTLQDFTEIAKAAGVRRISTQVESLGTVNGKELKRAAAIAVIKNPWFGTGTSEDLFSEMIRVAPLLAKLLADRLNSELGGADAIEAFGKCALVGTEGELEHASALVHTPYFGNLVREMMDGTSIICFVDGMAEPGEVVRVPMWHKTAAATRDYYQTIEVNLADAPHADEIAVIAAASTGPRPHARIGDRTTDKPVSLEILKEITL